MADPAHRREAEETHQQDPRIERRRLDVKLDALRREMAARPVEIPGRMRTLLDELRWRGQLRRSSSPSRSIDRFAPPLLQLQYAAFVVNSNERLSSELAAVL